MSRDEFEIQILKIVIGTTFGIIVTAFLWRAVHLLGLLLKK